MRPPAVGGGTDSRAAWAFLWGSGWGLAMASVPLGSEAPSAQLPVVLLCGVSDGAAAAALSAVQAFGRVAAIGPPGAPPPVDAAAAAAGCAAVARAPDSDGLLEATQAAAARAFDVLVLRADAPAEPAGVAECLGQRLEGPGDDGAGDAEAATLSAAVRLGAVLTAVDASSVVNDLVGNHVAMCDRFDDCDEPRSVGELVAEQIEQADVIVVVGTQPTDAQNVANATALCTALNPRAAIVGLEGLGVALRGALVGDAFQFANLPPMAPPPFASRALSGLPPLPAATTAGLETYVYAAKRPMHPRRFFEWLDAHFVVDVDDLEIDLHPASSAGGSDRDEGGSMDDAGSEGEEEEVDATAEAMNAAAVRARCEAAYGTLARSWGCVWLAGRPAARIEWSQVPGATSLRLYGAWAAALPREQRVRGLVELDPSDPAGDRRQELVFVGRSVNVAALGAALDACLCAHAEVDPSTWRLTPEAAAAMGDDPFDAL